MIAQIIERGYVLDEEMEQLTCAPEYAESRQMFWTEDGFEHFHGIVLDATHFVLANQILMRGPRTLIGLVGIYSISNGTAKMRTQESIDVWKKAGENAIRYANRNRAI